MRTSALPRRGMAFGVVLTAVMTVLIGLLPSAAMAQEETDDEGGTRSLRETLDAASTAYQDATALLEESERRELSLLAELEELEEQRESLVGEIQLTAETAYRNGRVGPFTALLNSNSPAVFMERAITIEMLAQRENDQLSQLEELSAAMEEQHQDIAEEIALQDEQVAEAEAALEEAEAALFAVGGGASGSFEAFPSEDAEPAPRGPDGTFAAESCTEPDPTGTGGCMTPRTLHAYNEAQLFGFTRYASAWRQTDFGEHGLGRAIDFAAAPNGFGGVATGDDKTYGDRLASFFVHNADALGVQYVIWFNQIWFPGQGWSAYGGGQGDPSSNHENHVHLSVR